MCWMKTNVQNVDSLTKSKGMIHNSRPRKIWTRVRKRVICQKIIYFTIRPTLLIFGTKGVVQLSRLVNFVVRSSKILY